MKNSRVIAKKKYGQNFLIDKRIQERIVDACSLDENDTVLEIGPGLGAITELIASKTKQVIAIEKDKTLALNLLEKYKGLNIKIINADILEYPFEKLPKKIKVISNLPYNIATPIIEKMIKFKACFTDLFFTVQLEYGLRIIAKLMTKAKNCSNPPLTSWGYLPGLTARY